MRSSTLLAATILVIILAAAGCGPSDEELAATTTAIVAQVYAQQTANAPTATATPTLTPNPTNTPTPTPTNTPSPTPTATFTPALEPAVLQITGSRLLILPQWQVGDKISLEMAKERVDIRGSIEQSSGVSHAPVEIVVVERSGAGYVLEWTYGTTEIEGLAVPTDALSNAFLSLSDGLRLEYEVSPEGDLLALRNWQELEDFFAETIQLLRVAMAAEGASEEEIEQLMGAIEPLFQGQEQVEVFAIEDPGLYHLIYGWPSLDAYETVSYESVGLNPLSGDPLPVAVELTVLDYEPGAQQITIEMRQVYDLEVLRQSMLNSITEMAIEMGSEPPAEDEIPSIEIEQTGTYVIDVVSGWVVSAEYTKKSMTGQDGRIETITLTRVD